MLKYNFKKRLTRVLSFATETPAAAVEEMDARFQGMLGMLSADIDELEDISELGDGGAYLYRLALALGSRRVTDRFTPGRRYTEEQLLYCLRALLAPKTDETVYCVFLDGEDRLISIDYINEGTVNASDVLPRKMLSVARKRRAQKAIIAHNHPAGQPIASHNDYVGTARVAAAFRTAGKEILRHYIIAGEEYTVILPPTEDEEKELYEGFKRRHL